MVCIDGVLPGEANPSGGVGGKEDQHVNKRV